MLNHITLHVDDFSKAKAFYLAALSPLGYNVVREHENVIGLGIEKKPEIWIQGDGSRGAMHIAFTANDKAAVDAFYSVSLQNGGKDNGAPGIRKRPYTTNYAAFVLDQEGNNIEGVCDDVFSTD